jgi:hypothetical protein
VKSSVIPYSSPAGRASGTGFEHLQRVSPRCDAPSTEAAARDWLARQKRVIEGWRDALVADLADARLIAALDQHAHFLRQLDDI